MKSRREFRQMLRQAKEDHELRHRPTRLRAAIFDSIHLVPEDAWNAVVPAGRCFMRRDYLAAMNKKYRSRVRSVRRQGEALERRRFALAEIGAHHQDLRRLFATVH